MGKILVSSVKDKTKIDAKYTQVDSGLGGFINKEIITATTVYEHIEKCVELELTAKLKECEAVYFGKGWKDNSLSKKEHEISKKLGIKIIYE